MASPADAAMDQAAALSYWSSIPTDVNGMLGGYPQISRIDLQGSSNFLTKLRRRALPASSLSLPTTTTLPLLPRAADCGAGIGRITLGLLSTVAITTDIIEPIPKFTDHILHSSAFASLRAASRIGNIHNVGLEAWHPSASTYDLIWNQWCVGQLTDAHLTAYLRRCSDALKEGGWCVIKENVSTNFGGEDEFDATDSSVTRSEGKFARIFKEAGMKVVKTEVQRGFPKELFPVRTWALQPEAWAIQGV